jgi:hypothetical protein
MSAIHWLTDVNGSFTNAADWRREEVPGPSDSAILDAVGSTFTVTSDIDKTVKSVRLASNAILSVTAGTFTASAGTGGGVNAGIILVGAGAAVQFGGRVTNNGTIALDGASKGAGAALLTLYNNTTLTGSGDIVLGEQGDNVVGPPQHQDALLYNDGNTIMGSGTIAKGLLVFNESGAVINANGSAALVVRGRIDDNAGLVEATGAGGLIFNKAQLQSFKSGVVLASGSSTILFVKSYLSGGTFETAGSGRLVARSSEFGGQADDPLVLDANLKIEGTCEFSNTIENNGAISLPKGAFALAGPVTLEGRGTVDLGNSYMFSEEGSPLTIAGGTIKGSGSLVGPRSSIIPLTIGAAGVIEGYDTTVLSLHTGDSILNAGTILSTGSGSLTVQDAIVNNGTLSVKGDGVFQLESAVTGDGRATIGGGALDCLSSFNEAVTFAGPGTLALAQSGQFTNSITGFSASGATTLDLGDIKFVASNEATFSGTASGGVLTVTDGTHTTNINLVGDYLGVTFVASSDGKNGVDVIATGGQTPSAVHFVNAMAAMTGHGEAGGLIEGRGVSGSGRMMLAAPRLALA